MCQFWICYWVHQNTRILSDPHKYFVWNLSVTLEKGLEMGQTVSQMNFERKEAPFEGTILGNYIQPTKNSF